MTVKDNDPTEEKTAEPVESVVKPAQPVETVAVQPEKTKNKQNMVTIAIITSVLLFFIGLGLGYVLGHATASTGRNGFPANGRFTPPSDNEKSRSRSNSDTDNDSNNSDDSTNSTNNSNTQTN